MPDQTGQICCGNPHVNAGEGVLHVRPPERLALDASPHVMRGTVEAEDFLVQTMRGFGTGDHDEIATYKGLQHVDIEPGLF